MARESIRTAISPNERLQLVYHPWTSYVIVPLFALANAGIPARARLVGAGRLGCCEACPHDLREFATGPVRRSRSTKKVGVVWTPDLRPPSMSARTRS
jgi:hypothetical protein